MFGRGVGPPRPDVASLGQVATTNYITVSFTPSHQLLQEIVGFSFPDEDMSGFRSILPK